MAMEDDVHALLATVLARPGQPIAARLDEALRLLCKYRSERLAAELCAGGRPVVRAGPFAGMVYTDESAEGSYLPKLLGSYEAELQPLIASLAGRGYERVLNPGCAEGYYAVGLARLLGVEVNAFDVDERARALCAELARRNGVDGLVAVHGALTAEAIAAHAGRRVLVVCDIEGAETELLDPEAAPALRGFDLLVEVHESFAPGVGSLLRDRFAGSHRIEHVPFGTAARAPCEELRSHEHLDQLLALWEWRLADEGWLWLEATPAG